MQWIILIGNEHFNLNLFRELKHEGENKTTNLTENRIVVDFGSEHVFYEYAEDIINDYENEERNQIPFLNPSFIIMTYTDERLMKKILRQDNFPRGIYVDDDAGNISPIETFILS